MREIEAFLPKDFLARYGSLSEIEERLGSATARFAEALDKAEDAVLYRPIAEGKWSPAEITDHLIRANILFAKAVRRPVEGREPLEMPRGRLSEEGRPIAPDEGLPTPDRPRAELLADLRRSHDDLVAAAREAERHDKLGSLCVVQSFLGPLTGLECLQLSAWHVRHHAKQLSPNKI